MERPVDLHPHCDFSLRLTATPLRRGLWDILFISPSDTLRVSVSYDDIHSAGFALPAVTVEVRKGEIMLASESLPEGVGLDGDPTMLSVRGDTDASSPWTISAGDRILKDIIEVAPGSFYPESIVFESKGKGEIRLDDIMLSETGASWRMDAARRTDIVAEEDIKAAIAEGEGVLTGYWEILDRDFDETLLRPGGDYQLAIIPTNRSNNSAEKIIAPGDRQSSEEEIRYDIIYLSGASIEASKWVRGEIKGHLVPSRVSGIYDVIWIDACHHSMSHSLEAQLESPTTLRISFPYQSSLLRLQKIKD